MRKVKPSDNFHRKLTGSYFEVLKKEAGSYSQRGTSELRRNDLDFGKHYRNSDIGSDFSNTWKVWVGAGTRFARVGFTHAGKELQQEHVVAVPVEERKEREEKEEEN
uniref:Uncharacterized protein n=1 Tax=Ficus carica TaxID=3494 RepID=A0AA87ZE92_FICCA|nr:hypothetical protein TIFTF001_041588 [Ficus carica]